MRLFGAFGAENSLHQIKNCKINDMDLVQGTFGADPSCTKYNYLVLLTL